MTIHLLECFLCHKKEPQDGVWVTVEEETTLTPYCSETCRNVVRDCGEAEARALIDVFFVRHTYTTEK